MNELNYRPVCGDHAWPDKPGCVTGWRDDLGSPHHCWLAAGHAGDCICACDVVFVKEAAQP